MDLEPKKTLGLEGRNPVQVSKHFVVLAPFVEHAETGKLLSRESWRSRGWCRFERVCREFLCDNPNIAVIESPKHWYLVV